jgi:hypothetical protein
VSSAFGFLHVDLVVFIVGKPILIL